jgi:hypothetical protein
VEHFTAQFKARQLREIHTPGRQQELPDRRFLEFVILYASGGVDLSFPEEEKTLLGVVVQFETARSVLAVRQVVVQNIVQFGFGEIVAFLNDADMWQYDSHGSLRSLSSLATCVWNPLPPVPRRAISMPEKTRRRAGSVPYLVLFQ